MSNSEYFKNLPNDGVDFFKHSKLEKSHEETMLTKRQDHEKELKDKDHTHELALKAKDLGWLGRFFGGKELVSLNVSGLLIIVLIISGVVLSCLVYDKEKQNFDNITKIWSVITPIITLSLGYLFGNKQGGKD